MEKLLWVALCGSLAFPLTASAGDEWEEEYEIGPAVLLPGANPGEVFIDATGGQVLLEYPSEMREFASIEDFVDFAQKALNSEPLYNEEGKLVGILGMEDVSGEPCEFNEETITCTPYEDPVAAFLGGVSGKLLIAGQEICVDATKCEGQAQASVLAIVDAPSFAAMSSTYDVWGKSWVHDWDLALGGWYSTGGKTYQGAGGYDRYWTTCWKWDFIPYPCKKSRGWNELWTNVDFFDSDGNYRYSKPGHCTKCESKQVRDYALWVGPKPDSDVFKNKGVATEHHGIGSGGDGEDTDYSCAGTGC